MPAVPPPMPERPASLTEKLKARIATEGPLTVADYMDACLADPEFGYYRRGDPFGAGGDFVTAPEISQIFGELIGLWCVEVWRAMAPEEPLRLVELGPGRGTLMADALRAARLVPEFLEGLSLHLVETSPALRAVQAARLEGVGASPQWHDDLAEVPPGPAIVIANEFLDALPVRQFERRDGVWHERCVGLGADGALSFCTRVEPAEPSPDMDASEGTIIELRPGADALIRALARRSQQDPVMCLVIDYGAAASGHGDTLQAVRAHRYADPLNAAGEADLTAHVDFGRLATAARTQGLAVWGPLSQGAFLLGLGLAERCERLVAAAADPDQGARVSSGAARLVDPAQMGELFKVLCLGTTGLAAPPPFAEMPARHAGQPERPQP